MKFSNKNAKRIGIFVFFNKDGVIGDYVRYLLDSISNSLDKLYIVCNCELKYETLNILRKYSDNVYVRENKGLDAAAFKKGLLYYCGIDELANYDEVVLFNDTVYGPFVSFENIFEKMSKKDIDFWGIMACYEQEDIMHKFKEGYIPAHIQSWFWVFRKSLIKDPLFEEYWNNYNENISSFWDVVYGHECRFTHYFEKKGFKWDVYCEEKKFRSNNPKENYNYYGYNSYLALKEMNMPFLKRKPFSTDRKDVLYMNGGQDIENAVNFLKSETFYPVDLIYRDLLKNYNIYDIYNSMNLSYIVSDDGQSTNDTKNVLIFVKCLSLNSYDFCKKYVNGVADGFKTVLCLPSELKNKISIENINKKVKIIFEDNDCGILSLNRISNLKKYEYIIFINDADEKRERRPRTIHDSILYDYMENLIKNSNYVTRLVEIMKSDKNLGLLMAPNPIHNKYFSYLYDSWCGSMPTVQNVATKLKLSCNINQEKPVISSTGSFCCKRLILDKMLKIHTDCLLYEDLKKVDIYGRLLQFASQDQELYAGVVMSKEYASVELLNYRTYLAEIMKSTNETSIYSLSEYSNLIRIKNQSNISPCVEPVTVDCKNMNSFNAKLFIRKNILKILKFLSPVLIIKKSIAFDKKWYSEEYNVKEQKAAKHYLYEGYKKGYNPSIHFNGYDYYSRYDDVRINNINPLLHYEVYGRFENRFYR